MRRTGPRAGMQRLFRAEEGSAMVEFVISLSLLFTFLFLLIAIGQTLWYHQIVTKGVRDGVRYLSRAPLEADFIENAKRIALTGTPDGSEPAFTFWNDTDTIDIATASIAHGGAFAGPDPLVMLRMTATVPVPVPVLSFFDLGTTLTLTVSDEARHIGE